MARRVAALALALATVPGSAGADHPCRDLLLLKSVMARTQGLVSGRPSDHQRLAFELELSVAERRFATGNGLPPEISPLAERILSENRLLLDALKANPGSGDFADRGASLLWQSEDIALHRALERNGCLIRPAESRAGLHTTIGSRSHEEAGTLRAGLPAGFPTLAHLSARIGEDWSRMALALGFETLALIALFRFAGRRPFRRGSRRHVCNVPGALEGHLYCEGTVLLDLSRSGCKLRLNDSFTPEGPVLVHVGNRTIPARAKWSNAHYAGLRFDQKLTEAELNDILSQANRTQDANEPPVPALPCHSRTCRDSCMRYLEMQRLKAPAAGAAR